MMSHRLGASVSGRFFLENPRNLRPQAVLLYVGIAGSGLNTAPTQAHHRYAINFRDYPLTRSDLGKLWHDADRSIRRAWAAKGIAPVDYPGPVAEDWPDLLAVVEEKVKPARAHLTKNAIGRKRARLWWQYGSRAQELYSAIAKQDRVLAISRVGQHGSFAFLPGGMVYSIELNIFPISTHAAFCALQSRPHEIWARFFGSSMKDDLRYTPSDIFETFPFPPDWTTDPSLEAAGSAYYAFRADLMARHVDGLTKTYNRFHNPNEQDPDIVEMRALHTAMDRAVLDAYGWTDIPMDCVFLPDHEADDDASVRKGRYRYRWPNRVRDEVLARLLELNADRTAEERDS